MTERLLAAIFIFINSVIATTGYAGVTLLMAIESACIPLPSELIMPFAGYLVFQGKFKLLWVATAGAIGCNLGSLVAYEIGCYGGRPLVERGRQFALPLQFARAGGAPSEVGLKPVFLVRHQFAVIVERNQIRNRIASHTNSPKTERIF